MPLDQRVSAPYGDVYTFATPKTDRFIANHEAQERQDELYRRKEVDDLDKQLTSHLGNVLNPDIPDLVNKWQDYKQSKKQLLFDNKIQRDPNLYAQKQVEVNQKLADVMQLTGDSSARKKALADQLTNYYKTPHKMEDNFADRFNLSLNTPTSLARQHPDFDNHYWTGPDEDFTKTFNDAKGKERVLRTDKTPMGTNGEQLSVKNISGFNDPVTYQSQLNAKNNDRKYSMQASKVLANMSPEEINKINQDYAALPADKFKNWNIDKPSLEPGNPDNPSEMLHSIQAKAYALNSNFNTKEGRPEINTEIRRQLNWQDKVKMLGLRGKQWANQESVRQNNRITLKSMSSNKAGGSEDDNLLVHAAPEVFKSGDPEKINLLLGNFTTGGAKNVDGIKVGMEVPNKGVDNPFPVMGEKPVPTVRYIKDTFVYDKDPVTGVEGTTGHREMIPHVIQFDPNSPNLQEEVVKALNEVKGKDLKLTKRSYNMDKITGKTTETTDKPVKATKATKVKKEESAEDIMKRLDIKY